MRLCYMTLEQVFFIQLHKAKSAPSEETLILSLSYNLNLNIFKYWDK